MQDKITALKLQILKEQLHKSRVNQLPAHLHHASPPLLKGHSPMETALLNDKADQFVQQKAKGSGGTTTTEHD